MGGRSRHEPQPRRVRVWDPAVRRTRIGVAPRWLRIDDNRWRGITAGTISADRPTFDTAVRFWALGNK
jgi:hypothetical protein